MMKPVSQKFARVLLLPLTATMLASCAPAAPESGALTGKADSSFAYVEGVPGGVATNVVTVSAKVSAIDYTARKVTLVDETGNKQTVQVGPEAVNFNQIRVGDLVKVAVVEEMVVALREKGASGQDAAAGMVARAPEGSKPAALAAKTVEVTATVKAVDIPNHKATLLFSDGSTKVVKVRPDVEVSQDKVGREVTIRVTEAVAISVEKP